jgi:hypothetical protein
MTLVLIQTLPGCKLETCLESVLDKQRRQTNQIKENAYKKGLNIFKRRSITKPTLKIAFIIMNRKDVRNKCKHRVFL